METKARARPLSPHLSIWRWGPSMAASIMHRVSGHALAFAGLLLLVAWLFTAALGPAAFEGFMAIARSPVGMFVLVGLSWLFFQHMLSGLRHLVMDAGLGLEVAHARGTAFGAFVGALLLTVVFWAIVWFTRF